MINCLKSIPFHCITRKHNTKITDTKTCSLLTPLANVLGSEHAAILNLEVDYTNLE